MKVEYYKCLVIEIDPFCESHVVFDENCKIEEHDEIEAKLQSKYPDKEVFWIILKKQGLYLGK